jgi:hypothetical protein
MPHERVHTASYTRIHAQASVSAQQACALPISQQSTFVLASLSYHDYEGVALRDDEKPRLQADLGGSTWQSRSTYRGPSIVDAFLAMYIFETSCQIQIAAQAGGTPTTVDPRIVECVTEAARTQTEGLGNSFVWPALLRKLARTDNTYRT